uniref:Uncharacterized protein n=1 Tax=Rhizophora mucronata TaxID=61149 RepID=A0A2P2NPF5_RHIMU
MRVFYWFTIGLSFQLFGHERLKRIEGLSVYIYVLKLQNH